jgi:hypothetical protein
MVNSKTFTAINHVLNKFDNIQPNLRFIIGTKERNKINLLNTSLKGTESNLLYNIYHKSTANIAKIHN